MRLISKKPKLRGLGAVLLRGMQVKCLALVAALALIAGSVSALTPEERLAEVEKLEAQLKAAKEAVTEAAAKAAGEKSKNAVVVRDQSWRRSSARPGFFNVLIDRGCMHACARAGAWAAAGLCSLVVATTRSRGKISRHSHGRRPFRLARKEDRPQTHGNHARRAARRSAAHAATSRQTSNSMLRSQSSRNKKRSARACQQAGASGGQTSLNHRWSQWMATSRSRSKMANASGTRYFLGVLQSLGCSRARLTPLNRSGREISP